MGLLIIFDLDGVLVEAKPIHYNALNAALKEIDPKFIIGWDEHLSIYDGLKTVQKLQMLSEKKGLPITEHKRVWQRKQELTQTSIRQIDRDERLVDVCEKLVNDGHVLACCSNAIRRSVMIMLSRLGVIEYMDLVLSNEDVKNSKPHPEIYWSAMSTLDHSPSDTLIIEDSPPGLLAAAESGASVLRVKNPFDLTYEKIQHKLQSMKTTTIPSWQGGDMNIVIPMAGAGSRFANAGYTFPKPLIDVAGMPMIQRVIANIHIDANYIFLVQKEHRIKYNLDMMFKLFVKKFTIIEVDQLTEGATCTVLLAKKLINNDNPMFIVDSDQLLEWDSNDFMYKMQEQKQDGSIITFTGTHPMWSFARIDEKSGRVIEVAEKNPISNIANAGLYYWTKGKDFVKYAEQMISKNLRVNNEFYVSPVYNEAIADGKIIKTYHIEKRWSLGVPEDLEYYLAHGIERV